MAVTVLKTSFSKALPKDMLYRDYKNFEQDKFKYKLKNRLQNESTECYSDFENFFVDILNEHVSFKKKFLRANHAPYVTKGLRKAIMRRPELKSKYLKLQTQESFKFWKPFPADNFKKYNKNVKPNKDISY